MKRLGRRALIRCLIAGLSSAQALPASALCTIDATPTISPASASTGTYTAPTAPIAQGVTFTVSGTYTTTNNISAQQGECTVALSFNRATAPITVARSGGGATMGYTVQSLAGGGSTLIYTGGGTPGTGNMVSSTFQASAPNSTIAFSVSMTAYFLAQPVDPQRAGSYSDSILAQFFNIRFNGTISSIGSRAFSVSGSVASSCTIGGSTAPAADSATIPVSSGGIVDTTAIAKSYASVSCNSLADLLVTSQSGAVKNATSPPSGFTNLINYSASASYAGATSTLNTATIATATGAEAGTTGTTSSAISSGTLSVTITPAAPGQTLIQGNYSDTLRITLTAQ